MTKRIGFSVASDLLQLRITSDSKERMNDFGPTVRLPVFAGTFYPRTIAEQEAVLSRYDDDLAEERVKLKLQKRVVAALVPHAGWQYSGRLVAKTLKQIETPDTILIFAPKHSNEGDNFAVMPLDYWDLNGRKIGNDLELVERLVSSVTRFTRNTQAHQYEHSIETLLPFIARYFPKTKVVGVLIGRSTKQEILDISMELTDFFSTCGSISQKKILPIISSDMHHYANESVTRVIDKLALDALETGEPERLYEVVMKNRITMCGVLPAYLVLTSLKRIGRFNRAVSVGYTTSGEISGDYERVVGYAGYLFE